MHEKAGSCRVGFFIIMKNQYILTKDSEPTEYWGFSLKHKMTTTEGFATDEEALAWRKEASRKGRQKYRLFKLEEIKDE